MRILIATLHRNIIGGTEKYLHTLIDGLSKRDHELGLVYEEQFDPQQETIDSADLSLPAWRLGELGLEELMRRTSRWEPDIVYSHGLSSGDLEDALLSKFPTVLFAHNYYGVCATGSKCHASPRREPCTRRFGPACLLMHYPRRCGGLSPLTAWQDFQRVAGKNARLPEYRGIFVASNHMLREYQLHGVNPEHLHLVPLATADQTEETIPLEPRASQGRMLLIGRLVAAKGGDHLLRAISKASAKLARPLTLTVAGDGPEKQRLQELAARLGVPTEFAGWVNTERKLELLRETDVLAVPSLWPEPFGLVGIEAGRWGVPAVGYAVGGIPGWLIPGRTGELAPGDPPTVDGLSAAILRVFSEPDHLARLRQGAWELARQFTLEAHLNKLLPLLEQAALVRV